MSRKFFLFFCVCTSLHFSKEESDSTKLDWWQTSLVYQIYPLSFKDSNGDGYGDLNGIYEKLDYIKDLGVTTIWIQPFSKSPMVDLGYDISDFKSVDPVFGTIADFKELVKAVKNRGMKLIIDFVPNHTSDQSEWFKLSEQRTEPYTDFYIWRDGKKVNDTYTTYPNNWISIFGTSAWFWSKTRQQYYYHKCAPEQPDLNYRNPKVITEIESVLRFWLDLGVDGFRVDAVQILFEAAHGMDEPKSSDVNWIDGWIYTWEQPENIEMVKSWRALLDAYSKKDGQTRLLAVELYSTPTKLLEYTGNATNPGAHIPFYFNLIFADPEMHAFGVNTLIHQQTDIFPRSANNWVMDNHDNKRLRARLFDASVDSWNMLVLLLPGLASVYYGTEIGLDNLKLRSDQRKDRQNGGNGRIDLRDIYRGPMQWDDTDNAGFSTSDKTWLPVHPNYWRDNVKAQQQDPYSHLNIFKRLAALRKTPVIMHGDLKTYVPKTWVFMFTRSLGKSETIAVLMNVGSESEEICPKDAAEELPDEMFVHTCSGNSKIRVGEKVRISSSGGVKCFKMRPQSGLVLSTSSGALSTVSAIIILLAFCAKFLE
ncbi:unnamed protein product [Bemisia tabaci]|uniref:alpha-glucosidase n=2 Tax=Bemisia tabaci TaxID=7038 RepID=A0A9P0F2R5_BEMTA|nr:unnamed protein product [Bemisia tabaci]